MAIKFSLDLGGMLPLEDYVRFGRLAEDYGFDEIHVVDDLTFKPAWPLLTLIGANTSRIRLGPWLIAPRLVHPAYHAANLALLDLLTGGRAVCALGRGAFYDFVGLPPVERPLTMIREAVEMIRRLLAGDRRPYEGEIFRATPDLCLQFEPVQRDIPILIGTFGQQTCELAGRIADGFVTSCTADPGVFRMLRGRFEAGARAAGRDAAPLQVAASPICALAADGRAAYETLRRMLPRFLPFFHPLTEYAGIPKDLIRDANAAFMGGDLERAAGYVSDDMLRFFAVIGTPREVVAQVEALIDAGVNHVAFTGPVLPDAEQTIRLLGDEVLPRFRR
jgi:5,10-methylenetetrahydromethanopterin reductase